MSSKLGTIIIQFEDKSQVEIPCCEIKVQPPELNVGYHEYEHWTGEIIREVDKVPQVGPFIIEAYPKLNESPFVYTAPEETPIQYEDTYPAIEAAENLAKSLLATGRASLPPGYQAKQIAPVGKNWVGTLGEESPKKCNHSPITICDNCWPPYARWDFEPMMSWEDAERLDREAAEKGAPSSLPWIERALKWIIERVVDFFYLVW